jgi:uncharacterized protein (UPF0303 family)
MSVEKDLAEIAAQEAALQFDQFGAEMAWTIGCKLRERALRLGKGMTFQVQIAGRVLFEAATDGASGGQADWVRRKRNTVMRFGRSSYAVGLQLELDGQTMEARHGLALADYAAHGGGFPIVLRGTGLVGTVVASGLPQREDHALVVAVLGEALGVSVAALDG